MGIPYRGFMVMRTTRSMRAPGTTVKRNFCNIIASGADSKWHRGQNAHAFLNDAVEKEKLRHLIARGRITAENVIKFIHQFAHDRGVLCEKKYRPRQGTGSRFETGSEQNCRLTDQLGVGHAAVFIIAL